MQILRWALIVPAGFAGFILGLLFGFFIYYLGGITCPAQYVTSGTCFAPWSQAVFDLALVVGAGVAAAAIVVMSALMAPSRHLQVGLVAYCIGAAFATYAAFETGAWLPYCSAVSVGGLSLWALR